MPTFCTMIVTAADAPLARQLAESIDPGNSSGMWETALAASSAPTVPTHYVSTGYVSTAFADVLPLAEWAYEQPDPEQPGTWVRTGYLPGNAAAIVERAAALDPPVVVDQAEVERLFADSDVTTQDPWVAFGRLGLVLVQTQPELG
jgi:hypothetical protein